jgi:hypothetical protein
VDLSPEEFKAYLFDEGPALVYEKKGSTGNEGGSLGDYF